MGGLSGQPVFGHGLSYTATIICSSTSALRGKALTPIAARACRPESPKTATNKSEAPLMTAGGSGKPATAFTYPFTLTICRTLSSEPRVVLQHRELGQGTGAGCGVALGNSAIGSDRAGDHPAGVGRNNAGEIEQISCSLRRNDNCLRAQGVPAKQSQAPATDSQHSCVGNLYHLLV